MITAVLSPAQRLYLDAIRVAAAMMVLFGHASHYFLPRSFLAEGWPQGLGVYLFFLISGFLIGLSVFQKHQDPSYGFRDYFIDRFCRIYSAFVPALIFVLVLDGLARSSPLYAWGRDYNPQSWLGNLVMLQDFPLFQALRRLGVPDNGWFIGPFGSARPFWTISIEWWIYMLFGGVVLLWLRSTKPLDRTGVPLLAVAAIEPIYHFVGGYDQCLTILWLVGMGASFLFLRLPTLTVNGQHLTAPRLRRITLIVTAAAAAAVVSRFLSNHAALLELQFGLFLGTLIFAAFFALGVIPVRMPPWLERVVGFLAGYSYSLYLVHHTLLDFLAIRFADEHDSLAAFWLAIAAANLVAVIFWYLFERHHRHLARFAKLHLANRLHIAVRRPHPRRCHGTVE